MLIPLTNVNGKHTFGLSIGIIWVVERDAGNPLTTRVITTIQQGAKGMVAYEVVESPEQIINLIAQAMGKTPPKLEEGLPPSIARS